MWQFKQLQLNSPAFVLPVVFFSLVEHTRANERTTAFGLFVFNSDVVCPLFFITLLSRFCTNCQKKQLSWLTECDRRCNLSSRCCWLPPPSSSSTSHLLIRRLHQVSFFFYFSFPIICAGYFQFLFCFLFEKCWLNDGWCAVVLCTASAIFFFASSARVVVDRFNHSHPSSSSLSLTLGAMERVND